MDTTALDAARDLLPAWVVWFPVVAFPAAAAIAAAIVGVGILVTARHVRRLAADAHWTERARAAWPIRRVVQLSIPFVLIAVAPLAIGGPLSRPGLGVRVWASQAIALAVVVAAGIAVENRLVLRVPLAIRLRSLLTWTVLWFPAYILAVGYAVARAGSRPGALETLAGIAAIAWVSLRAGRIHLARALGLARRPEARAARALERALAAVPGPAPALVELRIAGANAFALPLAGVVCVTDGALRSLDDDELAAILAHEVAHLRERRPVRALRALVSLALPAAIVATPALLGADDVLGDLGPFLLVAIWIGPVLAARHVLRRLEARADEVARSIGPAYPRALEKIYRFNLAPANTPRSASHPPLYDRLVGAGLTPDWARPARPPSVLPALAALAAIAAAPHLASSSGWGVVHGAVGDGGERSEAHLLSIAVHHCSRDLSRLGYAEAQQGRYPAADALYRAAEALDPENAEIPVARAAVLAYVGRCADARAELARAATLDPGSRWFDRVRSLVEGCEAERR